MNDKKIYDDIKYDIDNLKNCEFRIIPSKEVYKFLLGVVLVFNIQLVAVHMAIDLVKGSLFHLSFSDFIFHLSAVFYGNLAATAFLYTMVKGFHAPYYQFKNHLKSRYLFDTVIKKTKWTYLAVYAALNLLNLFDHMSYVKQLTFDFTALVYMVPSFIVTYLVMTSELERLTIGPVFAKIAELFKDR